MKQSFRALPILLIALVMANCGGQKEATTSGEKVKLDRQGYIERYKNIAVQEMRRTGIPASITLAQGILESDYGRSMLAQEAKNHFGIKCHKGWDGPSVRKDDDKKNECFRKYENPEKSYIDHSDFLTTRPRYSFLFKYNKTDYKRWARGLKRAGYATNPDYANLLINIIEKYNLNEYDKMKPGDLKVEKAQNKLSSYKGKIIQHNGVKTVIAQPGQSWLDIATEHDIRLNSLHKYNDYYARHFERLIPGEKVYLEQKKGKGNEPSHTMQKGETMYVIAQEHGIRLEKLYKRNNMEQGEEPITGAKVILQNNSDQKPALKSQAQINNTLKALKEKQEQRKELFLSKKQLRQRKKEATKTEYITSDNHQRTDTIRHIVSSGETLYSVSHKYYIPVNKLKKINNLTGNYLQEGQRLIIPPNARGDSLDNNPSSSQEATPANAQSQEAEKQKPEEKTSASEADKQPGQTVSQKQEKEAAPQAGQGEREKTQKSEDSENVKEDIAAQTHSEPEQNKQKTPGSQEQEAGKREANEGKENASSSVITHTVKQGETLFSISQDYGASVKKLKSVNNLTSNALAVGQVLKIPGKRREASPSKETLKADEKDEKEENEQKANEQKASEQKENQANKQQPKPSQTIIIHVVKSGQTLFSISRKYDVEVQQIIDANDNLESHQIQKGQKLKIPSSGKQKKKEVSKGKFHTVQSGETLFSISQKYDASVEKLKKWNNLSSNSIEVGQELRVKE